MLIFQRSDDLRFVGYSNSGFASCLDDMKSTSSYMFTLVGRAFSWKSVLTLITFSTMQVEFVACYEATSQAL